VRDPKAFLMDEPLSNLDAKLRVQMRTEVARIQRRLGTTMVYVTHDQTEAMTLGDRVAVMRAGIIQQVDSPATLYDDPVNLFVAGFIGSPSMNFVPGRLEGDKLELPFGSVPLPDHLKQALQKSSGGGGTRDVIAGVRPEHFEDAAIEPDRPGLHKFKARIDVLESMGSELYAYFDIETGQELESDDLAELAKDAGMEDLPSGGANQHVVARLDSDSKATAGGEIELVLDTTTIKLFDPDGGRSLTYTGTTGNGAGATAASAAAPA
jgi:multiple sugar transport system ATP-binding protein